MRLRTLAGNSRFLGSDEVPKKGLDLKGSKGLWAVVMEIGIIP